jgi:small-conductance mechanosensitive channel
MTPLATSILDQAGNQLGGFLPRLGGALLLLVIGLLVARIARAILARVLRRAGVDELAEKTRTSDVLARAGLGRSLAAVIAGAVRLVLSVVVIFAALSLLGLQFLSESLNHGVLFLPKLLIAGALLLTGVVLGGFARERVDRLAHQMDFPISSGAIAQVIVVSVFAITAAAQIAISTLVLLILVGVVLAGAVSTLAIAFGLGGRELARAVTAGRYVRGAYTLGQNISIGDVRGRITQLESASTLLRGEDGTHIRVPNHLLLESIVTVHSDGPAEGPESSPGVV